MIVRPVSPGDFAPLARLDLRYPTARYLHIERAGSPPQMTFRLVWRTRGSGERAYAQYDQEWLRGAAARADFFAVAEVDAKPVGLAIAVLPGWTNAAEITDLLLEL